MLVDFGLFVDCNVLAVFDLSKVADIGNRHGLIVLFFFVCLFSLTVLVSASSLLHLLSVVCDSNNTSIQYTVLLASLLTWSFQQAEL